MDAGSNHTNAMPSLQASLQTQMCEAWLHRQRLMKLLLANMEMYKQLVHYIQQAFFESSLMHE